MRNFQNMKKRSASGIASVNVVDVAAVAAGQTCAMMNDVDVDDLPATVVVYIYSYDDGGGALHDFVCTFS